MGLDAVNGQPSRLVQLALGVLLVAPIACQKPAGARRMVPEVLRELPHDTLASTQGLLLHDGLFYESLGGYGSSALREVDPETGEVLRSVDLAADQFGEGLALVGERLIQITWMADLAYVYDLETLEVRDTLSYDSQGWGLCFDGEWLYSTDGSATLYRRDPVTFSVVGARQVSLDGAPLRQLNELECVGDDVYANVFLTDRIVRIDKATGEVLDDIDASALLADRRPANDGAVLNGIAHDPERDMFYLTGKLWPIMYEVRFVPR